MTTDSVTQRQDERLELEDGVVEHTANLPANTWLRYFALPAGSLVEFRDDLADDHTYESVSMPTEFNGTIQTVSSAEIDTNRPVHTTEYSLMRAEVADGINAEDYVGNLLMFSRVRLPSGVVIELPWKNEGNSPFSGTHRGIVTSQTINDMDVGTIAPLSNTAFSNLQPGDLIVDRQTARVHLVTHVQEGSVLVATLPHSPDTLRLKRQFAEMLATQQSRQERAMGGVLDRLEPGINLQIYGVIVGHMAMPALPELQTIDISEVRAGDIVECRNTGGTHFMAVRFSGFKRGARERSVTGVWSSSQVEAERALYNASYTRTSNLGEFTARNGYTIRRVASIPPPAGWVTPTAFTPMTVEEVTALGLTLLRTEEMDSWDVQRILAALTPDIVRRLVAAGITQWDLNYACNNRRALQEWTPHTMYSYATFALHADGHNGATELDRETFEYTGGAVPLNTMGINPSTLNTVEPYCSLSFPSSGLVAVYYPETQALAYGYSPVFTQAANVPFFRASLERVAQWAETRRQQMVSGELRQRVEELRFQAALQTHFGISRLPRSSELIFGNRLVELRPLRNEEETPEVIIMGQKYRVRQVVENIPRKARAVMHFVDGNEAVAKRMLESRFRAEAESIAGNIADEVLTPTRESLQRAQDGFTTAVNAKMSELSGITARVKAEVAGMSGLVSHHAKMYDILGGLMSGVLPPGWYARVAPGGFMEACVDSVTWTDITTEIPITTPVKLRVRCYYSESSKRWQTVPYTESEHRIADRSFWVHPHISANGYPVPEEAFPGSEELRRAGNNYRDPIQVGFCFGAANGTVKAPAHAQFPVFFTELREYLAGLHRVLISVMSSGGYGWHSKFMAYAVATGYATSPWELPRITQHLNFTHVDAADMVSYVESHRQRMAEYTASVVMAGGATPTSEGVTTLVAEAV